jgi:hypothetical protein
MTGNYDSMADHVTDTERNEEKTNPLVKVAMG